MQTWLPSPLYYCLLGFIVSINNVKSFAVVNPTVLRHHSAQTSLAMETVEVCGSKDCRRAGGGARLEKQFKEVLVEHGLENCFQVENCGCQGECGYGPNVIVKGKLINDVIGKDAIAKALGISTEVAEE